MKKDIGNKVRLGIFVSVGLVLFIVGIYYIGQKQRLFTRTFRIRAIYHDVNGLQVGNNVRFSGINIGTVDGIEIISDTSVKVDMVLDKSIQKFIKTDATAAIGSEGLMGNKVISIAPGSEGGKEIGNNDQITATEGNNMDAIMAQVKITAENAAHITGDMSGIVSNIRNGKGTIGKLFMDSAFANNLSQTIVNVKTGAGGFSDNMEALKHNFLLKGYYKKKEKEKDKEDKKAENQADKSSSGSKK